MVECVLQSCEGADVRQDVAVEDSGDGGMRDTGHGGGVPSAPSPSGSTTASAFALPVPGDLCCNPLSEFTDGHYWNRGGKHTRDHEVSTGGDGGGTVHPAVSAVDVNFHPRPVTFHDGLVPEDPLTGQDPRSSIVILAGVDVAFLALSGVDLSTCLLTGAHYLDRLRLEGHVPFAEPPAPARTRLLGLPVPGAGPPHELWTPAASVRRPP